MRRVLTDELVRQLRERRAQGVAQHDLAEDFGISQSLVSLICTGQRFPDAGGPIDERAVRYRRRDR